MFTIALIYDHLTRPETTGIYCLRALAELARVEQFHPSQLCDIRREAYDLYLFVDDGLNYSFPHDLRPQAYWAVDTHLDFRRAYDRAADADLVFSAQRDGSETLERQLGRRIEWLPLACDPMIHARQNVPISFNVCFVGNLIGNDRTSLVRLLQSEFLDIHVGRHFFEDMAAVYSASRLVFNRSVANDVNMRVFEGLCSGSLVITNDLSENGQEELFRDAQHIVTYSTEEELLDKVRFYLRNQAVRERIAAAGREEAITNHTYAHRMRRILDAGTKVFPVAVSNPPAAIGLGKDTHYFEHSRPEVLALIPLTATSVLDIGCGAGHLGRLLKRRQQCVVYGVEINNAASMKAQEWLDQVWHGDIESIDLDLPEKSLDTIVCGDVLEHLRDPRLLLLRLARYLKDDGQVIASIPNIGHHTIIRGLLAGNWTYESAGLLDETHMRFFTAREIEKIFFRAGFRIERMDVVQAADDATRAPAGSSFRLGNYALADPSFVNLDNLMAYQYLIVAAPDRDWQRSQRITSIILVTNNQLDYTKSCLASICSRTDEPYEIVVVDNGSTDGTVEYLRQLDGVRLVENDKNRGFPAAANQGIHVAQGDYILLLNNDCIVTTGWLSRLLAAVNSESEVGLAGPCSNHVSGEQQIRVDYQLQSDIDGFAWEWGKSHAGEFQATGRLVGFCLLIKRSVIDRIGVLDEQFGIGNFEDDDFCCRAIKAGFKAVIARDAFVHHFGEVTFRANQIDFTSLMEHNHLLFQQKWKPELAPTRSALESSSSPTSESGRGLGRPKLSLCMIVRDSARTLDACLESIKPWVDELIVVDTGSTDATAMIAEKYGAKLFQFPWCDDFSAARNHSLAQATGDWIFWMDSDDTIDIDNGRKLRKLLDDAHKPDVVAYVAQVHCPHENGGADFTAVDHVKIFRNLAEIRFTGRIHEQVLPAINRLGGHIEWTNIFVEHSGSDQSREGQARKLRRDLKLLVLENAEHNDHPFTLFNLGMTYLEMKHFDVAARWLTRTISVAGPQESHVPKAYSLLIQALSGMGKVDLARHWCEEGIGRYPDDPELSFRAGILARDFGRLLDAERYYLKILETPLEHRFRSIDQGILGYKTRQNLACLYHELGRYSDAEANLRMVLVERPAYGAAWRGLVAALLKQGKVAETRELVSSSTTLGQCIPLRRELEANIEEAIGDFAKARQIFEEALRDAPEEFDLHDSLCRLLFEHSDLQAAESALFLMVSRFPDNAAAVYNLAMIYLRQRRYEAAVESFQASLFLRPNWPEAYVHLAECYRQLGREEAANAARANANRLSFGSLRENVSRPTLRQDKSWYTSAEDLASAVEICVQCAERERSKLSSDALAVLGMTSRPIRHLLNLIGELPGCRFLEVGTGCGATALAASFDNSGSYITVDDFSEFETLDFRSVFYANRSKFSDHCHIDFCEDNCWNLPSKLSRHSVNVFFYDGTHTHESHRAALLKFADILTDPFVLLVDDWNLDFVQQGTKEALEELGWTIQKDWRLTTNYNGNADTWWNGLLVAVVSKKVSTRESGTPSQVSKDHETKDREVQSQNLRTRSQPSICLVVCYFGPPPAWIKLYLASCAYNPTIDFLILTDQEDYPDVPPNVRVKRLSPESFNALATKKIGFEIRLCHSRKLCDFKPAYGHLFEDLLEGWDYWGYTDLDVIYGDLRRFLIAGSLQDYDVFTARAEYLVGHCSIFRNDRRMKVLYQQSADYPTTLRFPEVLSFDECGEQWAQRLQGERLSASATCDSMSHIVQRLMDQNEISACFFPGVVESPELTAPNWRLRWDAGRLWRIDQQPLEVMYIHFHAFKQRPGYREPCFLEDGAAFEMTPSGFERSVVGRIEMDQPENATVSQGMHADGAADEDLAQIIVGSRDHIQTLAPVILSAFDWRHLTIFYDRFLESLRAAGNNEVVIPVAIGLHPREQGELAKVKGLNPVFHSETSEQIARRRLRLFAEITGRLPPDTPVAYWDAGDVIFQSELQLLWSLVRANPKTILAAREPSGYPDNPVVVQWTEHIADSEARRNAQELLFNCPFINGGFLAGSASELAKYFETAADWYNSPKLAGTTDPCDQTALNLYCHSRPDAWREVSESWNYCLWGRTTCYRHKDGRYVDSRGVAIHVVHGNAHTLGSVPYATSDSEF